MHFFKGQNNYIEYNVKTD